jgi:G3E family GTPase
MAVNGWLARLRATRGPDLLRVKGILDLRDETAPIAIHGIHHVFHPPTALAGWPDGERHSRVVLIGRDLDQDAIRAEWELLAEA